MAAAKVINIKIFTCQYANFIFVGFIDLSIASSEKDNVTTSKDGMFALCHGTFDTPLLWHRFHDATERLSG